MSLLSGIQSGQNHLSVSEKNENVALTGNNFRLQPQATNLLQARVLNLLITLKVLASVLTLDALLCHFLAA